MSDQMQLSFVGDWRITVTARDASWAQRVTASGTASGTQTLGGNPGAAMDVYGDGQVPWTLSIEHDDGTHGWQPNFVRGTSAIAGPRLSWVVEAEDDTSPSSDRDFNDLVIGLGKLGLVGQPVPPFAILPCTLQAMPEGVFEATLGRYLMAVRVQNIWTLTWPAIGAGRAERPLSRLARRGRRQRDRQLVGTGPGSARPAGRRRRRRGRGARRVGNAADLLQGRCRECGGTQAPGRGAGDDRPGCRGRRAAQQGGAGADLGHADDVRPGASGVRLAQ